MELLPGGIDVYYIDESMDKGAFAMSAVSVPFLRNVDGKWTFVWDDSYKQVRAWRTRARSNWGIPIRKELHGSKFAAGRGRYNQGKYVFHRSTAVKIYASLLSDLTFLQDASIITVTARSGSSLYGQTKLQALLYALLQRMRTACDRNARRAFLFFDEGHNEYRKLYRRARVHLPTGSRHGMWSTGSTSMNIPLSNFTKDANFKQSHHCYFTQIADLIAFAALSLVKKENSLLSPWQQAANLGDLYDAIPIKALNLKASYRDPRGIVRL